MTVEELKKKVPPIPEVKAGDVVQYFDDTGTNVPALVSIVYDGGYVDLYVAEGLKENVPHRSLMIYQGTLPRVIEQNGKRIAVEIPANRRQLGAFWNK